MARLADDWLDERQSCVDVLCAYLRMPWDPLPVGPTTEPGEAQVRSTILSVIGQHIRNDLEGQSWKELRFDFTGAELLDVNFREGTFLGSVIMDRVRFHGEANVFDQMSFVGNTSFYEIEILRALQFYGLVTSGHFLMFGTKVQIGAELMLDFAHVSAPEWVAPGVETSDLISLNGFQILGRCNLILAKQSGDRAFISMAKANLGEGASFVAIGRTVVPVVDQNESLVFPTLNLVKWMVGPNATVRTVNLRPEGNVQWTESDEARSSSVLIG